MEHTQNKQKDQWQIALDKKLEKLHQCQHSKGLSSCMRCDQLFACELKKEYVRAVYESMNKGAGGGFEF